jgi:hypothetical protein
VLAAHLRRRRPCLLLAQHGDDLFFREPASLHRPLLPSVRTLTSSGAIRGGHSTVSKFLTKDFTIGVIAGYYQQVSDDRGSGNGIGPFKGQVTAVGGTASYNFNVGATPVSARIKVLREVEVENRPEGTIGLFTVSFPIGGAAPTPPKPITAKY